MTTSPTPAPVAGTIPPPSPKDVLRYRYQHGCNLGSIFVLEKWLCGSMYPPGAAGESELDAVNASIRSIGLDATRAKWQNFWASSLSETDFNWLKDSAHCTTIRLPIGWFTLGPAFCKGTLFEGDPAQVYVNAWAAVKNVVARCYAHGIGVLLDLHAVPGGANGEIHSGTSSKKAALWGDRFNLELAAKCLTHIALELKSGMDGVTGLQLCNEAAWEAAGMYDWYDSVMNIIVDIDATIPIYISDGWNLPKALKYAQRKNSLKAASTNPVIIDTHKYYTFSDSDRAKAPQQHIEQIPRELGELEGVENNVFDRKGATGVFIGEYSNVLDGQTWSRVDTAERPEMTRHFGLAQSQQWQSKTMGSAFWTLKMDWMDGGDWGFKQQVDNGAITPPKSLTLPTAEVKPKIATAESQRETLRTTALNEHTGYWDSTSPKDTFEHWRFGDGWDVGFNDAAAFLGARANGVVPPGGGGGDKIGAIDLWVLKRLRGADQGGAKYGWEWEQGFRRGVMDLYTAVGV